MTVNASPSIGEAAAPVTPLRAWLAAAMAVAIALAVFAFAFRHEIVWAVKVWDASTAYNHCYLVLPLVAALLWQRREVIAASRPAPSLWALCLVPVISATWLAAALLDILEAEQLAVVALFDILLLALLGWRMFRALMAPLLFLFFLVPFGAFVVPALQRFTAAFAVAGLDALGIPVFADRLMIQIPTGVFEVAEACAGLRFLIASIVFGCFFATIVYRSPLRRALFIGLSILLPVVANGCRALGLILFAHYSGNAAAMEADHILYGWVFFTLVTLLLIVIGLTFTDRRDRDATPSRILAGPVPGSRIALTMTAGLVLAMLGPAYMLSLSGRAAAALPGPSSFGPVADSRWTADPAGTKDWRPQASTADSTIITTYRRGEAAVTEFVALYRFPTRGNSLTRTSSAVVRPEGWRLVETGRATTAIGGRTAAVNTASITKDGKQRLVWWTYVVDGQVTPSALDARLLQARAALGGGGHIGALIAVTTETPGTAQDNATLGAFLKALQPLL